MTLKLGGQFETYNDPMGNPLIALNRDGTVFTQGIDFGDGTKQTTAGGGAALQTNGTPNSIQTLLNLAGSGGITVSNSAGTTTISGSGAGGVLTTNFTASAADILSGAVIPKFASPGAGKYLNIIGVMMEYVAGTTGYTDSGGGSVSLLLGTILIATVNTTGPPDFMLGTASQVMLNSILTAQSPSTPGIQLLSNVVNKPINFQANSLTLGNGTLAFAVQYTIETA